MVFYVYSTMSTDIEYRVYIESEKEKNGLPRVGQIIHIAGGANVANKNFITPKGVLTTVTDKEAESLLRHPVFIRQKNNGFITLEKKNADPDKVAADLEAKDGCSPLTGASFQDGQIGEVKVIVPDTGGKGGKGGKGSDKIINVNNVRSLGGMVIYMVNITITM